MLTTQQQAELELIRSDCAIFLGLGAANRHNSVFWLALPPNLAFFAIEVVEWHARARRPFRAPFLTEYDSHLRSTRARIKMFDGDSAHVGTIEALFAEVTDKAVLGFNRTHTGLLGALKRWLQCDLGLYYSGNNLVCTTHLVAMNLALDGTSLGDEDSAVSHSARSFGLMFGRFLATLAGALNVQTVEPTPLEPEPVDYEDWKGAAYYRGLSARLGIENRAASLTWLVSQVNFVHHWLRHALPKDSGLLLRFRFLTAFHSLSGLQKLVNGRQQAVSPLRTVVARLVGSPEGRVLRRLRATRNLAAHYSLEGAASDELAEPAMLRVFLARVARMTPAELDRLVDEHLEAVSSQVGALLRPTRARPI